jgi:hypothetical protein
MIEIYQTIGATCGILVFIFFVTFFIITFLISLNNAKEIRRRLKTINKTKGGD